MCAHVYVCMCVCTCVCVHVCGGGVVVSMLVLNISKPSITSKASLCCEYFTKQLDYVYIMVSMPYT